MNCPYCQEKINDAAIVCGHCTRDLQFLRPLMQRVVETEKKINDLSDRLSKLEGSAFSNPVIAKAKHQEFSIKSQLKIGIPSLIIQIVISVFVVRYLKGVLSPVSSHEWGIFVVLAVNIVVQVIFGFLAGSRWPGRHTQVYLIWGILGGLTVISSAQFLQRYGYYDPVLPEPKVSWFITVTCALAFLTGGLAGDWFQARRLPDSNPREFPSHFAQLLVNENRNPGTADQRIERLAKLISAIAPLLTFAGTLVAAWLTYKATIYKATFEKGQIKEGSIIERQDQDNKKP